MWIYLFLYFVFSFINPIIFTILIYCKFTIHLGNILSIYHQNWGSIFFNLFLLSNFFYNC